MELSSLTIINLILSSVSLATSTLAIVYLIKFKAELDIIEENLNDLKVKIEAKCPNLQALKDAYCSEFPNATAIRDEEANKNYTLFVKEDELYLKEV
jgi:hypothetical protein